MGHRGLRGRRSPELTPGAAHTGSLPPAQRGAPPRGRPQPWAPPAPPSLHPDTRTEAPPLPSSLVPGQCTTALVKAASSSSALGRIRPRTSTRLQATPLLCPTPSPQSPGQSGLWTTRYASHMSIRVLSLSSQFGHWPQLPPLLCPEALPDPGVTDVSPQTTPSNCCCACPSAHSGTFCPRAKRTAGLRQTLSAEQAGKHQPSPAHTPAAPALGHDPGAAGRAPLHPAGTPGLKQHMLVQKTGHVCGQIGRAHV